VNQSYQELLINLCFVSFFRMDWKAVDERLIRFLDAYEAELKAMNAGKVGHPYTLTGKYIVFLTVVRFPFSMPYRQLEGFY
jgi:hypothetical protein